MSTLKKLALAPSVSYTHLDVYKRQALDSVLQGVAFFAPEIIPTEVAPTEMAPTETAPTEIAPTERPRPEATARQTPIAATPLATPSPTMLVVTIVGPPSPPPATLTATPAITLSLIHI